MTFKPKNASAEPRPADREEMTDPGGPSPEVLERARRLAAEAPEQAEPAAPAAPASGDATLIYDRNKRRPATEAAKLIVVGGPRAGTEFQLTEVESTIGRGSDNAVVIPDISVSRRHVTIRREADRYVLLDLGSGNGTRLNGKPVERQPLTSGDEIAMGDTVVRFVEPGGVVVQPRAGRTDAPLGPPPAPPPVEITHGKARAPPGFGAETFAGPLESGLRRRKPLYFGLVVLIVLLLLIGLYRKQQQSVLAPAPAASDAGAFAQQRFEEGVRLVKEARWIEARDKLKVAAELAPENADVARYLERAEAEEPRARAVLAARAALAKRDYAEARSRIHTVPEDSALSDQAHQLAQELKAAMDGAVREARIRVENGDGAGARESLAPVLAAEPGRADALAVRDAAGGARRGGGERPPKQASERASKAEPSAPPAPETAPTAPAAGGIVEAYLSGDLGTALERADGSSDPKAQRLGQELKAFDAAYRDGVAKMQANRLKEALRALEQADKVDRAIAGRSESRLGRDVRRAVGNLHHTLGVQAMGADETLGAAGSHLRAAVAADPENADARRQLAEVVEKAKELYQRAYFEKENEPDSAKKLFRIAAEALPPGDELAQKARRWQEKLEGRLDAKPDPKPSE